MADSRATPQKQTTAAEKKKTPSGRFALGQKSIIYCRNVNMEKGYNDHTCHHPSVNTGLLIITSWSDNALNVYCLFFFAGNHYGTPKPSKESSSTGGVGVNNNSSVPFPGGPAAVTSSSTNVSAVINNFNAAAGLATNTFFSCPPFH